MSDQGGPDRIKTTETSLELIETIRRLDGARPSTLAQHFDLSRSTIHQHLRTLKDRGYLAQEGDVYHIGLRFYQMGAYALKRKKIYEVAKRETYQLSQQIAEEVNFSVLHNGRKIVLFTEINNPTKIGFQTGKIFYLHNTAAGKAMLAKMSDERIHEIIDQWGLPQETDYTIVDRDELFEDIEQTRERGYAVNVEEDLQGLKAIGVAIEDPFGDVFAGLDVSGAPYRMPDDEEIAELLLPKARELEEKINSVEMI